MSYAEPTRVEVTFADHERITSALADVSRGLNDLTGMLRLDDSWPLESGQVGVIFVPSDPPSTACVLEHPDTGHWMLQYPCGGIYIADLTTGTPTF